MFLHTIAKFCLSLHTHIKVGAFLFSILFVQNIFAAAHTDHVIKGTINGYAGKEAFLSMLYGGNQYIMDTAAVTNGSFVFKSHYELQTGVYVVVLPPSKSFFLLVDQNLTDFSFTADFKDIEGTIKFEKSPENNTYYEYLKFIQVKRMELDRIRKEYDAKTSETDKAELLAKMQQFKKEVTTYQSDIVTRMPGTFTAAMIKSELPVELPVFNGSPEEMQMKRYQFQRAHYFDNIDLADERLVRTPKNVIVDRVEYFLDNLTPQQPDSINAGIDFILKKSQNTPEAFRFLLTHIFNKYQESKKIGMDGVYVHIAENYIAKNRTPWIEGEEKKAVLDAAKSLSPTLIGKKAPNFAMTRKDGRELALYDIRSAYTVVMFSSPGCELCQEGMPVLTDFYKTYKSKGVEVLVVCTRLNETEKICPPGPTDPLASWITADERMGTSSTVKNDYNIRTTPKILLLDANKTILIKDIGVESLSEVMKRIIP